VCRLAAAAAASELEPSSGLLGQTCVARVWQLLGQLLDWLQRRGKGELGQSADCLWRVRCVCAANCRLFASVSAQSALRSLY